MNNKGFTLVELLATIVIIGLVMGIATNNVLKHIKTTKTQSEKIFIEKTTKLIDEYLSTNGSNLTVKGPNISFEKEYYGYSKNKDKEGSTKEIVTANELNGFNISELINKNLVDINDFINPSNKKRCLEKNNTGTYIKNPQIRVWKDSDYVYYYYIDLSKTNTSCDISEANGIISTITPSLCLQISNASYDAEKRKCIIS